MKKHIRYTFKFLAVKQLNLFAWVAFTATQIYAPPVYSQQSLALPESAQPRPGDPLQASSKASGSIASNGDVFIDPNDPGYPKPGGPGSGGQQGQQDLSPMFPRASNIPPTEFVREKFFPMTPKEIRNLRKDFEIHQRASNSKFNNPKPENSSILLDISPNSTPFVVRVIPGAGAVVSFKDATGAPWPIVSFQNFNRNDFEVGQPADGSNFLSVASLNDYASGNVAVVLQNYSTPIIFSTVSTQSKIDARVDVKLPLMGPYAKQTAIPTREPTSKDLIDVLYGVLPSGSRALSVSGAAAKAWQTESGDVLITGSLQVLSPLPKQRESIGDGYYAYRLPSSPVYLVSQNGSERKMIVNSAGIK